MNALEQQKVWEALASSAPRLNDNRGGEVAEAAGFRYKASPTGLAFHESDAFVKALVGPFASGKSTAAAMDIYIYSLAQPAALDKTRYSRWGVIRASYPNLKSTTRNTLLEVLPAGAGTITQGSAPLQGVFKYPVGDGTLVQLELVLISAKDEEDTDKLRSLNWTGCWINEATEVSRELFNFISGRVGRYPTKSLGGCGYAGILMDFNQPLPGHWLHDLMVNPVLEKDNGELVTVDIFRQPPAAFKLEREGRTVYEVNPEAENLENLKGGLDYYRTQITFNQRAGRTDKIENQFCMLDVAVREGKPVFPQFSPELHVAKERLKPASFRPVVVGYDTSGIHPAAVIMQMAEGKWRVLDELLGEDLGLEAFMDSALSPLLRGTYGDCEATISVDPADAKDAFTALSPSAHLKRLGFRVYRPATNKPELRVRAVEQLLNLHQGGLLISPHCVNLIRAMSGGYRYRKLKISGAVSAAYAPRPEKDEASHVADALQYAALCARREDPEESPQLDRLRKKLREAHAMRRRIV